MWQIDDAAVHAYVIDVRSAPKQAKEKNRDRI